MARTTFSRRQIAADLFPELLTKRGQLLVGASDAYAREVGVSRMALAYLSTGWQLGDGDRVDRARFGWRSPYSLKQDELVERHYADLAAAGLVEPAGEGWRFTARGRDVVAEQQRRRPPPRRAQAQPPQPPNRAAHHHPPPPGRIPANAERARTARRLVAVPPAEPSSDAIAVNRAVVELWNFRDDCHIGAWGSAGYDGPSLDVLTQVWPGKSDVTWATQGGNGTVDDVAKALEGKQDRADVERLLEALARRGDIAMAGATVRVTAQGQRSRDAIEDETDRRFFAIWDLDDAATSRLGEDLRTVIDAIR